jgi:hypothetical protein
MLHSLVKGAWWVSRPGFWWGLGMAFWLGCGQDREGPLGVEGRLLLGPYLAGNRPPCSLARRISVVCRRWGPLHPDYEQALVYACSAWTRRCGMPPASSAVWLSRSGWHRGAAEVGLVRRLLCEHVFYCIYGSAAAELVALSGAVRQRARVGAGPDHGELDAVRVRPGGRGPRARPGARGRLLRGGEGLPLGLVPAAARTRRRLTVVC